MKPGAAPPITRSESPVAESTPERDRALALVQKLPASIRIGVYDYTIEKWDASRAMGARRWGEHSAAESRISIQRDMPTRIHALDTFLHEVNHGIWCVFNIQDEDKEERTVALNTVGWTSVYRDNPWLLDWIKEAVA